MLEGNGCETSWLDGDEKEDKVGSVYGRDGVEDLGRNSETEGEKAVDSVCSSLEQVNGVYGEDEMKNPTDGSAKEQRRKVLGR